MQWGPYDFSCSLCPVGSPLQLLWGESGSTYSRCEPLFSPASIRSRLSYPDQLAFLARSGIVGCEKARDRHVVLDNYNIKPDI